MGLSLKKSEKKTPKAETRISRLRCCRSRCDGNGYLVQVPGIQMQVKSDCGCGAGSGTQRLWMMMRSYDSSCADGSGSDDFILNRLMNTSVQLS